MSKVGLFLQRWARLKSQPAAEAVPVEPVTPALAPLTSAEKRDLPPVDDLTLESDFSAFMQPEVDAGTRRAAMKKLFMNEHYRTMDMLDVYVDDYSKPELLPAAMLQKLEHAAGLLASPEQSRESGQAALPADPAAQLASAGEDIGDSQGDSNEIDEAGNPLVPATKPEPPAAA